MLYGPRSSSATRTPRHFLTSKEYNTDKGIVRGVWQGAPCEIYYLVDQSSTPIVGKRSGLGLLERQRAGGPG